MIEKKIKEKSLDFLVLLIGVFLRKILFNGNKDFTYARRLDIRRVCNISKIPRLLTTLPNNLEVIERTFPDQEKFPKLVEFLKDLANRGLFEIIYPEMVEYARMTKKETMRLRI